MILSSISLASLCGILTPQVRGKPGPLPQVQLACTIEQIKEGRDKWRLYRLSGPEIHTPLAIAIRGSLGDGGPSRLVVLALTTK